MIVVTLTSPGQFVPHLATSRNFAPEQRAFLAMLPHGRASFQAVIKIVGWAIACVAVWGAVILT